MKEHDKFCRREDENITGHEMCARISHGKPHTHIALIISTLMKNVFDFSRKLSEIHTLFDLENISN